MSNIILSADTPCDIGPELKQRYNVSLFPLHILLDGQQYTDGVDICPDDLYKAWYERKILPKTSAVNPDEYITYFTPLSQAADAVIHISLGSGLSSSCANAKLAAESFDNVFVVDSRNLSTGFGHLVCEAGERIARGLSPEEIIKDLNEIIPRVSATFVVDTLEFLHAGGRCSALARIGANILNLKPCIQVQVPEAGSMTVGKKYTGSLSRVLKKYVADQLEGRSDIETDRIFITHSGMTDPAIVEELKGLVLQYQPFKELYVTNASCTISSHCGPNTLGVLFIQK